MIVCTSDKCSTFLVGSAPTCLQKDSSFFANSGHELFSFTDFILLHWACDFDDVNQRYIFPLGPKTARQVQGLWSVELSVFAW